MLNHDPKSRPNAVEVRLKYRQFVENLTSNGNQNSLLVERFERQTEIETKPTRRRCRSI